MTAVAPPPAPPAPSSHRHETVEERAARGRAARSAVPRSAHGAWSARPNRQDPIELLQAQAEARVPELVPLRYGRMLASPFAFYRGAAAVMAADLGGRPSTGLNVQLCGDAHLSNFGTFAGPDRRLLFDLNDFDETLPGPFEWDVERLVASVEVAGRQRGFPSSHRRRAVIAAAAAYRRAMRDYAGMRTLDVWYARLDVAELLQNRRGELTATDTRDLDRYMAKSRRKDSVRALSRLTTVVDGVPQFLSEPPLLVPISALLAPEQSEETEAFLKRGLQDYRATLPESHRVLLDRFSFADMARKVVGVGSVGTRAWVILMLGRDASDPLVLQIKEATASVLEPYALASVYREHGRRVVEGQRLMQAASDSLLGWLSGPGLDGVRRDFYVRQLWDAKGSADVDQMPPQRFLAYVRLCGTALARAHARSGDPVAIAAYLGSGDAFDKAMVAFATAYADVSDDDHATLVQAAGAGVVDAERES
jgi:uncharacterized protein (DUF2252 family)